MAEKKHIPLFTALIPVKILIVFLMVLVAKFNGLPFWAWFVVSFGTIALFEAFLFLVIKRGFRKLKQSKWPNIYTCPHSIFAEYYCDECKYKSI